MSGTVLVGFDGSSESVHALEWAIRHVQHSGAHLRIVVAWALPPLDLTSNEQLSADPALLNAERDLGNELMERALQIAKDRGLAATGDVIGESPARALVEASQNADMLVVGSRGRGTFTSLLLGSVSRQVASHAGCTTVVVRRSVDPESQEVVVGADGSEASTSALQFAAAEAARIGGSLRVLHGWDLPPVGVITGVPTFSSPEMLQELRESDYRSVAESLSGLHERYPDLQIQLDDQQGNPVQLLVDASKSAALVVVGSRGRGGFLGLLLGSVSHGVAHHAHATVAIVR